MESFSLSVSLSKRQQGIRFATIIFYNFIKSIITKTKQCIEELTHTSVLKLGLAVLLDGSKVRIGGKAKGVEVANGSQTSGEPEAELALRFECEFIYKIKRKCEVRVLECHEEHGNLVGCQNNADMSPKVTSLLISYLVGNPSVQV